jgi:hypothetical protein
VKSTFQGLNDYLANTLRIIASAAPNGARLAGRKILDKT